MAEPSGGFHRAPQQGGAQEAGEHMVLHQYPDPQLPAEMQGAEATWMSRLIPSATLTEAFEPGFTCISQ